MSWVFKNRRCQKMRERWNKGGRPWKVWRLRVAPDPCCIWWTQELGLSEAKHASPGPSLSVSEVIPQALHHPGSPGISPVSQESTAHDWLFSLWFLTQSQPYADSVVSCLELLTHWECIHSVYLSVCHCLTAAPSAQDLT